MHYLCPWIRQSYIYERNNDTKELHQDLGHGRRCTACTRLDTGHEALWQTGSGRLVRTLYATSFTTEGGYEYREDALPVWVSKAKPHALSSTQLDAITGATPQNGVLTYKWDGTDDNGNRVPPGRYTFFIEGTLYWKSRVIYSGELDWGGREQDSIPVKARYFHPSKTNGNMISGLKASHIKPSTKPAEQ